MTGIGGAALLNNSLSGGEHNKNLMTMVNNSAVKILDERNANSVVIASGKRQRNDKNNTNILNSKVNNSLELAKNTIDFTSIETKPEHTQST